MPIKFFQIRTTMTKKRQNHHLIAGTELWNSFESVFTWKVEGRKRVHIGSSDHVGNLIHYTLLGQILATMLTVSQSGHHLNWCGPDGNDMNKNSLYERHGNPVRKEIHKHDMHLLLLIQSCRHLIRTSSPVSSLSSWEMRPLLAQQPREIGEKDEISTTSCKQKEEREELVLWQVFEKSGEHLFCSNHVTLLGKQTIFMRTSKSRCQWKMKHSYIHLVFSGKNQGI